MKHSSIGEKAFDGFNYALMSVLIAATMYPLLYVLFASLSEGNRFIMHTGMLLYPLDFRWDAYAAVFHNPNILLGYRNTLMIVIFGTALNLVLTSLGAYGLSRKNVMLSTPIMLFIVFTMFFSGGIIPMYILVSQTLGLGNTFLALILPTAISTWNLIIMRTSFASLPEELIESSRIDGANDPTILLRIVVPLSMPVIAVMILFYGVHHWNAWFHAMIFLRDRDLYPLQLILREILIQNNTTDMFNASEDDFAVTETIKYATIIVAVLPILFVYPFLQRFFVKGVMIGAIKS